MAASKFEPSDMTQGDVTAEVWRAAIEWSESPYDLRAAYDNHKDGNPISSASKDSIIRLAETATNKLAQLGLDFADASDERIAGYQDSLGVIYNSDGFHDHRYHPTEQPEVIWLSRYHRILSAFDVTSPDEVRLMPQTALTRVLLFSEIEDAALLFTEGEEYARPHRYPRKAGRHIDDPKSEFWNYGIATDDYPGKSFGVDGAGPNVWVWAPTGVVTDASVKALKQFDYMTNQTWQATTAQGYVPERMVAQTMRMGVMQPATDQVDTLDGHVAKFLEQAKHL